MENSITLRQELDIKGQISNFTPLEDSALPPSTQRQIITAPSSNFVP